MQTSVTIFCIPALRAIHTDQNSQEIKDELLSAKCKCCTLEMTDPLASYAQKIPGEYLGAIVGSDGG